MVICGCNSEAEYLAFNQRVEISKFSTRTKKFDIVFVVNSTRPSRFARNEARLQYLLYRAYSSCWLEQWTHNPLVTGSTPVGPTKIASSHDVSIQQKVLACTYSVLLRSAIGIHVRDTAKVRNAKYFGP